MSKKRCIRLLVEAITEAEGRLIFAFFVTGGLFILAGLGVLSADQLLMGLFGEGAVLSLLKKED